MIFTGSKFLEKKDQKSKDRVARNTPSSTEEGRQEALENPVVSFETHDTGLNTKPRDSRFTCS